MCSEIRDDEAQERAHDVANARSQLHSECDQLADAAVRSNEL